MVEVVAVGLLLVVVDRLVVVEDSPVVGAAEAEGEAGKECGLEKIGTWSRFFVGLFFDFLGFCGQFFFDIYGVARNIFTALTEEEPGENKC